MIEQNASFVCHPRVAAAKGPASSPLLFRDSSRAKQNRRAGMTENELELGGGTELRFFHGFLIRDTSRVLKKA